MTKDEIINGVLEREGGYVNHPSDKGGPTNYGVTEKIALAHGYSNIRSLTKEQARAIYEADYWYGPRFDQVSLLSPDIAAELCDTGVNMGPALAAKFLQRVLNVMNNQQKLYFDLKADGQIGPRTISTLKQYLTSRGSKAEDVMLKALNSLQGARYIELSELRQANEAFTFGWFERVAL